MNRRAAAAAALALLLPLAAASCSSDGKGSSGESKSKQTTTTQRDDGKDGASPDRADPTDLSVDGMAKHLEDQAGLTAEQAQCVAKVLDEHDLDVDAFSKDDDEDPAKDPELQAYLDDALDCVGGPTPSTTTTEPATTTTTEAAGG